MPTQNPMRPTYRRSTDRTRSWSGERSYRTPRFESLEHRHLLAVLTVTTLEDSYYPDDGLISLREAVAQANYVSGADTIDFAPALTAAGPATILLTKGELRITDALTILGPGAGRLSIDASGSDPTPDIDDAQGSRIFNIFTQVGHRINVYLSDLTLTGGDPKEHGGGAIISRENLTVARSTITGNAVLKNSYSGQPGGAISNMYGRLTIEHSSITGNSATSGGGIYARQGAVILTASTVSGNQAIYAAGIYTNKADVTIDRTTISDNNAVSGGGGISTRQGNLTVLQSTISGNSAKFYGGTHHQGGIVVISESIISHNLGGGINNGGAELMVFSSTITHNTASKGGGVLNNSLQGGTTLVNCTISNNSAAGGGGIYNHFGLLSVENCTITGNGAQNHFGSGIGSRSASQVRTYLKSSIISGNINSDLDFTNGDANSFVSLGSNLIGMGNAIVGFQQPSDQTGITEPRLGPLVNNGGFTPTHALLPGSPAKDAGNGSPANGDAPWFDQRGEPFKRVYGGRLDIGAVESQPNPLPGDYNFDGLVSSADFVVWQQTLGSTRDLRADGNGDGRVNEPDRAVWMANFGTILLTVPQVTQVTVEPGQIARRPVESFAPSPAIVHETAPSRATTRPAVVPASTAAVVHDAALTDLITPRDRTAQRERPAARPIVSEQHTPEATMSTAAAVDDALASVVKLGRPY